MGFNLVFKRLNMARNLNAEACIGLHKWDTFSTQSSIKPLHANVENMVSSE